MFTNSSANLRLVERFTRQDANTLMYEFTVEDPTTWTRPWTAQIPMTKAEVMYEYACHEGNYGLTNILSGARVRQSK
jgi:meiotically up-regulated gene 157 (Mug157) protein